MGNAPKPTIKATSAVARSDDGTIQITFSIPYAQIEGARKEATLEMGKDVEVPGFRKGNAPLDKLLQHIPENTLLEKTLSKILPKLTADAINEHKIKPAIYPKFELLKAKEKEDWEIRAITCEIPEINLGDYKKAVIGASKAKSLWTPRQGPRLSSAESPRGKLLEEEKPKEPTREEKDQEVIKILLETTDIKIPKVLIEEESNLRLSQLLARLEKLGLTLEGYLASIGKTPQTTREQYEEQARRTIALELILDKAASLENIKIEESQIEAAIAASSADRKLAEELNTPERRRLVAAVLKRRAALEFLASLI